MLNQERKNQDVQTNTVVEQRKHKENLYKSRMEGIYTKTTSCLENKTLMGKERKAYKEKE